VAEKQLESNTGNFNIAHLPSGIYLLVVSGSKSTLTQKVFV